MHSQRDRERAVSCSTASWWHGSEEGTPGGHPPICVFRHDVYSRLGRRAATALRRLASAVRHYGAALLTVPAGCGNSSAHIHFLHNGIYNRDSAVGVKFYAIHYFLQSLLSHERDFNVEHKHLVISYCKSAW